MKKTLARLATKDRGTKLLEGKEPRLTHDLSTRALVIAGAITSSQPMTEPLWTIYLGRRYIRRWLEVPRLCVPLS